MTHLSVQAWILMLNDGECLPWSHCRGVVEFLDFRPCCGTDDFIADGLIIYDYAFTRLPTCPECSMIRESLILALEENQRKQLEIQNQNM